MMSTLSKYVLTVFTVLLIFSPVGMDFSAVQSPEKTFTAEAPSSAITSVEVPGPIAEPPVQHIPINPTFSEWISDLNSGDNYNGVSRFGSFLSKGTSAIHFITAKGLQHDYIGSMLYPFHFFL